MGISTISNYPDEQELLFNIEFQSPMGISTISNRRYIRRGTDYSVSIPNGDKHDFKLVKSRIRKRLCWVSIPNGDKHDFKPESPPRSRSERGVSIPNGDKHDFKHAKGKHPWYGNWPVSIPNGDKHDFKRTRRLVSLRVHRVSIPNGDKHDFKRSIWVEMTQNPWFQSPMGISMISNIAKSALVEKNSCFNPQWG